MSFRRIPLHGGLGASRNAFPQAHPLTALFAPRAAPDQERSDPEERVTEPGRHVFTAIVQLIAVSAIAGLLVAIAVTPSIALAGAGASGTLGAFEKLPASLTVPTLDQRTRFYGTDNSGNSVLLATFYNQDRQIVGWKDVPDTVKNAALAGEDIRFYQHGGVDPTGVVRALVDNLRGRDVQGASTITQQYVKNLCVQNAERQPTQAKILDEYHACTAPTLNRKIREMRYAIALEKKYSKDEILLGYLNVSGFGGRVYGIEAASEYYYGVKAKDLSIGQAASLVAILNNPSALRIDQKQNLAADTARRDYILGSELKHGMISKAQYEEATAAPVKPELSPRKAGCQGADEAGYFCTYVADEILSDKAFGKTADERKANLYGGGWQVYTTLNVDLEKTAQQQMDAYVPMTRKDFSIGGSAVSVQVGTGRILAMVQNKKFDDSGDAAKQGPEYTAVNYNTDQDRGGASGIQPGSTYKLFTLLQWLEHGHTLSDVVPVTAGIVDTSRFTCNGSPLPQEYWQLGNSEGEIGLRSVYLGLVHSINGAFASMAEQLDICDINRTAKAFGVHPATGGKLENVATAIIGEASTISPLAMTNAYAGMANRGRTCSPVAIDRVVKADGSELTVPKSRCKQSVDQKVADAANVALHGVFVDGTADSDQTRDGLFEIGKTGTTDNATNTWMIGSTTKVATGVWVGNVIGHQDLTLVPDFPYCPVKHSRVAQFARHCVWNGIQTAANAEYGGDTSMPQAEQQYIGTGDLKFHLH
jgi:membrane peptidoglycan carboxypeptidase